MKVILKTALTTLILFGLIGVALAEESTVTTAHGLRPTVVESAVKVNVRYAQYFGQYDTGKDTDTAYLKNFGETGVQFSGNIGNARFFIDTEHRSGAQYKEFYDVVARASHITPVGLLSIGKVSNYLGQYTTNAGGGIKASNGLLGSQLASMMAGITEDDGIDLMVPLMNKTLFIEATVWDKAAVKFRTWDAATRDVIGLEQSTKGFTTALGVMFKGEALTIKTGMTNETMDDYSSDADTAETNNYAMLSGKFEFGNMTVDASMVNATIKNVDKTQIEKVATIVAELGAISSVAQDLLQSYPSEFKINVTGLGFLIKDIGPGDLNVNYEVMTMEDSTDATGAVAAKLAYFDMTREVVGMSLFYSIKISEKIGYQFLYDSKETALDGGDTTTATYTGIGLFGFF